MNEATTAYYMGFLSATVLGCLLWLAFGNCSDQQIVLDRSEWGCSSYQRYPDHVRICVEYKRL